MEGGCVVAIRHSHTEWNLAQRMQGLRDMPLSLSGRERLRGLKIPERFLDFTWVSSPLRRCLETATLLGATEVIKESRIIEMDWGSWEGLSLAELRGRDPQGMRENESKGLDFRPKNGESPREVATRLGPWLEEIGVGRRRVIMVSHKGVLRALLSRATGWDMKDKAPIKLDWELCHVFCVSLDGAIVLAEPNVPFEKHDS